MKDTKLDLGTLVNEARLYAISYASPHHITFTVEGLRNFIAAWNRRPGQAAAVTDARIIEIADATKTAEPGRDGYILPIAFARALLAEASTTPDVPADIRAIIERLHTQDNRITAAPLFAVQQKRVIGGLEREYADKFAWVCEGLEVDREEAARLDALRKAGEPIPDDTRQVGYTETWEFVTGCFTEQGCKDYIAVNGHNLTEPRIYVYGTYRNAEFAALRNWLMGLRASTTTTDEAKTGDSDAE